MTPDQFRTILLGRVPSRPDRKWWNSAVANVVDLATTLYKETLEANPAPVIETANGAVDMEPNPAHHTTRRIAELNDVVAALNESNNALLYNQGIHEAAIAELKREVEVLTRRVTGTNSLEERVARIEAGHNLYTPITPPQPTPLAAPDEDALWEQVENVFYRVSTENYADTKAAVAKAAELGLVPTPMPSDEELATVCWDAVKAEADRQLASGEWNHHDHDRWERQGMAQQIAGIRAVREAITARTPMPSDEALMDIYEDAVMVESDKWPDGRVGKEYNIACFRAGIRAVREAITAAQPLTVPVPEIPEGWELNTLNYLNESSRYCAGIWGSGVIKWGYGPTWQEALQAAIVATGESVE